MQAAIIIKTANGYIIASVSGAIPSFDLPAAAVATRLDDSYRSDSVQEALRAIFEPKEAA